MSLLKIKGELIFFLRNKKTGSKFDLVGKSPDVIVRYCCLKNIGQALQNTYKQEFLFVHDQILEAAVIMVLLAIILYPEQCNYLKTFLKNMNAWAPPTEPLIYFD